MRILVENWGWYVMAISSVVLATAAYNLKK